MTTATRDRPMLGSHVQRRVRRALILVNTDYRDTPYDKWFGGDPADLYILVAAEKAEGYRHLPNVWSFAGYRNNGMVEHTALRLAKEVRFDVIVARCEPDLMRAGRLRDLTGVPGQGHESAVAFRDKLVMKAELTRAGIPVAKWSRLSSSFDLFAFVEQHGLPVVVKPIAGAGSLDTHVLRDEDDVARLLSKGIGPEMAIEAFVEGEMFHVDGVVVDGRIRAIHPSLYVNGMLSFQRGEYCGSYVLAARDPLRARLIDFTRQVVDGMPTPRHTTFHAEVFHTPDDRLVMCEVASRTGGCRINATLALACGIDLDQVWFEAQCGLEPSLSCARPALPEGEAVGWITIYPKAGVLLDVPREAPFPWVAQTRLDAKIGARYFGGYKSGDFLAGYVVLGDSPETLRSRFREIAEWFDRETRWQLG